MNREDDINVRSDTRKLLSIAVRNRKYHTNNVDFVCQLNHYYTKSS